MYDAIALKALPYIVLEPQLIDRDKSVVPEPIVSSSTTALTAQYPAVSVTFPLEPV